MIRGSIRPTVRLAVLAVWLVTCTNVSAAVRSVYGSGPCQCSGECCTSGLNGENWGLPDCSGDGSHDGCDSKDQRTPDSVGSPEYEPVGPASGSAPSDAPHCPCCPCPTCCTGGMGKTTSQPCNSTFLPDPPSITWQQSVSNDHYSFLNCTKLERPPRS